MVQVKKSPLFYDGECVSLSAKVGKDSTLPLCAHSSPSPPGTALALSMAKRAQKHLNFLLMDSNRAIQREGSHHRAKVNAKIEKTMKHDQNQDEPFHQKII